jgi:ketosteroid isomerase-like protein
MSEGEISVSEQENTRTVQEVYAAFGRGDVPFILSALADKVDWTLHGPPALIPWAKTHRTRDEVAEFFATLGKTLEFQAFEPREYVAQGDKVVALGYYRARAKATGRTFEQHWAMEWTLQSGKIVAYRAYDDTAVMAAALRPS